MNWQDALSAMMRGESVQRKSEQYRTKESDGIFLCGEEPMRLAHAWSHDQQPARVFQGAGSRCLFVPTDEQTGATDYVVVPNTKLYP